MIGKVGILSWSVLIHQNWAIYINLPSSFHHASSRHLLLWSSTSSFGRGTAPIIYPPIWKSTQQAVSVLENGKHMSNVNFLYTGKEMHGKVSGFYVPHRSWGPGFSGHDMNNWKANCRRFWLYGVTWCYMGICKGLADYRNNTYLPWIHVPVERRRESTVKHFS